MSRRARSRAAAVAAKHVALVPMDDHDEDHDGEGPGDAVCEHCMGDGMDADCDNPPTCPMCQGGA